MTLTNLLVPTYKQMLLAMAAWLEKAQIQIPKEEVEALLSARLAPDMYPLSTQIRFACLQAQEATYRLMDKPLPTTLDELGLEGRNADKQPGSFMEAQARIAEALSYLDQLSSDALDGMAQESLTLEISPDMIFDLTGEQYARDWALPQFNFHLMTAYAILRGNNVDLGKSDYVPHMFSYIRSGTSSKS